MRIQNSSLTMDDRTWLWSWLPGAGNSKNENVDYNHNHDENENAYYEDNDSPKNLVFFNEYLLSKILTYVSIPDLKRCREVCSSWQVESTKRLLKRQSNSSVLLDPLHMGAVFFVSRGETETEILIRDTLESFVYLIEKSRHFPCESFTIVGDLANEDLQWFFWSHGHNVKQLALDINLLQCNCSELSLKMLETLLTVQMPNLEKLVMVGVPQEWKMKSNIGNSSIPTLFSKHSKLGKLKEFDIFHSSYLHPKITSQILSAAWDLELFTCNTAIVENLNLLLELNKTYLLKNFCFCFRPTHTELIAKMSERNMQLGMITGICVCQEDPNSSGVELRSKIGTILTKCLNSSSASLQCIHRLTPIGSFPGLKIPQLPKLGHLSFEYLVRPHNLPNRIFPPELNMEHTFPSLTVVDIHFVSPVFLLDPHEVLFDQVNPAPSVKFLKFHENTVDVPVNWVQYFSLMFPNLQILHLHRIKNFFGTAQFLWTWQTLREIELTIQLDSAYNQFPQIEAAFTGFSLETCLQLNAFEDADIEVIQPNSREFWSMLHLPELLKLKVNFDCCECWDSTLDPVILSHVTGLFAFQMCPEIEVIIAAQKPEIVRSLTGVFPYVQLHP